MRLYFCLWLLTPVLFATIGYVVPGALFFQFTTYGLTFVGIPFVAFVVSAVIWSLVKKGTDFRKEFIFSPLVFGLFCSIYFFFRLGPPAGAPEPLPLWLRFSPFITLLCILVSAVFSWTGLVLWFLSERFRGPKQLP